VFDGPFQDADAAHVDFCVAAQKPDRAPIRPAAPGLRFRGQQFDFQYGFPPDLIGPEAAHFRPGVAFDHGFTSLKNLFAHTAFPNVEKSG
jgi:hypothetical protein